MNLTITEAAVKTSASKSAVRQFVKSKNLQGVDVRQTGTRGRPATVFSFAAADLKSLRRAVAV